MSQQPEPLSGGLVTARDPSLLQSGELTRADNLMYRPGSQSIHRAFGRTQLAVAAFTAPVGIAYCGFDQSADQLVVLANENLYRVLTTGGTATVLQTGQGGNSLDAVHYNNRDMLLTGSSRNRVLLPDGTLRDHGLNPVTATPSITVVTVGGTWPLGADSVPNFYEYWTTEVYKVGTEDVEGTFTGTPAKAFIGTEFYYVTINRPPLENRLVTHWRVYRSIATSASAQAFPVGFLIGELPVSTTSFNDGLPTVSAKTFPTTAANSTRVPGYPLTSSETAILAWTASSNLFADDGSNATGTSTHTAQTVGATYETVEVELGGFVIAALGSPITDIAVEIQGAHNRSDGVVDVALSYDGGFNWTSYHSTYLGVGAPVTAVLGGLWGRTWAAIELGASLFKVRLRAYNTNSGNVTHTIDYLAVTVTHSGSTGSTADLFDSIQVKVGGQSLLVGANGPPPVSTTGDVFQDSLVVNDVANPSRIAYSLPGQPDYFPSPYILNLETKDKDRLTCIRTIGSVCVFGLTSQVWRANYLPREDDAEFDRGRCTEVIDADNGILGPFGAAKFVIGGKLSLFYVSRSGPRITDGFGCETANEDLDWPNTLELPQLSRAIVVNNAENQEILVYYVPKGGSALTKYLRFQYHATHLKNGKLKASGPCDIALVAATVGTLADGERGVYTLGGLIQQENRGFTLSTPIFSTREIYGGGTGGEWELHRVMVHTQGTNARLFSTYAITRSNNPARSTAAREFEAPRRGFSLLTPQEGGEGITTTISAGSEDDVVFDYLVLEGTFVSPATPLSA